MATYNSIKNEIINVYHFISRTNIYMIDSTLNLQSLSWLLIKQVHIDHLCLFWEILIFVGDFISQTIAQISVAYFTKQTKLKFS